MPRRFDIPHRHKTFSVVIADDGGLELWVDGCLRKRRDPQPRDPLYVWTNIELDWEEHHYVEVRYYRRRDELKVTINGAPILEPSPTMVTS
ncbi:MAG: hypothetical protein OXL38_20675 [Gammaproteobacteria bacterium]|nr:hypothetical protein [Gammaproteobacteria bacterium]